MSIYFGCESKHEMHQEINTDITHCATKKKRVKPIWQHIVVYSNNIFSSWIDSPPSHGVSSGLQSKPDKKPEMAYPTVLKTYLKNEKKQLNNIRKPQKHIFMHFIPSLPKNNSIPEHYIVVLGCPTYASRWILLQSLKISHQPLPSWSRHCHRLFATPVTIQKGKK